MLASLKNKIKEIMLQEVKPIIIQARSGNMTVVEEKQDGDSATNADIQIGQLFVERLTAFLPGSIVINEEDFNENVFKRIKTTRFVWVVDPIDGTKAFRTPGNNEYCVAVALLDNLKPILSVVYAPEYELGEEKGLLFEAIQTEQGAKLNGRKIEVADHIKAKKVKCINHIHRDTELSKQEREISGMCMESEKIRAYDGHSTLVNYILVAACNLQRVFTRRGANIWDIVQGAYIVEKAGGKVYYPSGRSIFPIKMEDLKMENNKLVMGFNIASAESVRRELMERGEREL